jgi:predicted acetyltransferase
MTSETIERENRAAAPPAEVTVLGEDRWRESYDLFMAALHRGPASDERWAQVRALYHPGQVYGAFAPGAPDSRLIGTIMSVPLHMTLPGGAVVPAAGETFAGVRSGATRRGALGRMFRTQMNDLVDQGEIFLVVRPATADLWHRWGIGPAARSQHLRIDRLRSGARADLAERRNHARPVPPGSDLLRVLPEIQRRAAAGHPGTVVRSDAWWSCWNPYATPAGYIHAALAGPWTARTDM